MKLYRRTETTNTSARSCLLNVILSRRVKTTIVFGRSTMKKGFRSLITECIHSPNHATRHERGLSMLQTEVHLVRTLCSYGDAQSCQSRLYVRYLAHPSCVHTQDFGPHKCCRYTDIIDSDGLTVSPPSLSGSGNCPVLGILLLSSGMAMFASNPGGQHALVHAHAHAHSDIGLPCFTISGISSGMWQGSFARKSMCQHSNDHSSPPTIPTHPPNRSHLAMFHPP